MSDKWQQLALSVQAKRDASIPEHWRISKEEAKSVGDLHAIPFIESKLTPRELEITSMSATEVLKKLHSGEWTSVEVTEAICHRAAVAHSVTNCLTEVFFGAALTRARQLDIAFENNGRKPTGPLHGLPVSIKEEFDYPGTLTSWGFIARVGETAKNMATVPKILLEAGAVLYCKV